jgi:hypothetical protein
MFERCSHDNKFAIRRCQWARYIIKISKLSNMIQISIFTHCKLPQGSRVVTHRSSKQAFKR